MHEFSPHLSSKLLGRQMEISHFLLPADLWPCYTSVAPALAAAQHPPALPAAAAEHPNETERGAD